MDIGQIETAAIARVGVAKIWPKTTGTTVQNVHIDPNVILFAILEDQAEGDERGHRLNLRRMGSGDDLTLSMLLSFHVIVHGLRVTKA